MTSCVGFSAALNAPPLLQRYNTLANNVSLLTEFPNQAHNTHKQLNRWRWVLHFL